MLDLVPEHRPDRRGDVAGIERGRGDLVEHGLEEVVVAAIDQGDPHRGALEALRAAYRPAKPPPRIRTWGTPGSCRRSSPLTSSSNPMVWRRHRANRTTSSSGGMASSSP